MTTNETFERRLGAWLEEDSARRVPDHLDQVLMRTVATRQRPGWSSLERWLPIMDTAAPGRVANLRPVLLLALLGALVMAVIGVALIGAGRFSSTVSLGLADNGRIFVIDGTTLKSYDADGGDALVAAELPATAIAPSVSPDGRSVAYLFETPARLDILDVDDGSVVSAPLGEIEGIGGPLSWSPDSARLLFNIWDGRQEHLVTIDRAGTDVRTVDVAALLAPAASAAAAGRLELWPAGWSPTGDRIAFVAVESGFDGGTAYIARPDGRELTPVGPPGIWGGSLSWSPDPIEDRLVLTTTVDGQGFVHVLVPASGEVIDVGPGFWPTWSPDGTRIAYWHDGTAVIETSAVVAGAANAVPVHPTFTGNCQSRADLAGQAFCGPVAWSPDGRRLVALDIAGTSVLSVMADGSGQPIVIPLDTASPITESVAAWQPIRP